MVFAYAGLWLFSSLLNTGYAARDGSVLLGLAAVSWILLSLGNPVSVYGSWLCEP